MSVYYHITPKRNLSSILRHGLKPSSSPILASWDLEEEDTRKKIFLGREKEEAMFNLAHAHGDPDVEEKIKSWVLLKVILPEDWPLDQDSYGFLYTEKPIPPGYLEVEYVDSPGRRKLWDISYDAPYLDKYRQYNEEWGWL